MAILGTFVVLVITLVVLAFLLMPLYNRISYALMNYIMRSKEKKFKNKYEEKKGEDK